MTENLAKPPRNRTKSLLCRKSVAEYAMARAATHDKKFSGVSRKFYLSLEAKLKVVINDAVYRHPSFLKRLTDVPQGFI
jgi:hypothetical protein